MLNKRLFTLLGLLLILSLALVACGGTSTTNSGNTETATEVPADTGDIGLDVGIWANSIVAFY